MIGCDLKPEPSEELPGVEYRRPRRSAAGWALADLGRVDGLVANAGVTWRAGSATSTRPTWLASTRST